VEAAGAKHYRWAELPAEPMRGSISRRLITGERMMIAHVHLKTGDEVPRHSHENEQITSPRQDWLAGTDDYLRS